MNGCAGLPTVTRKSYIHPTWTPVSNRCGPSSRGIAMSTMPMTQERTVTRSTSPLVGWGLLIGGAFFLAGGPMHPKEDPPGVSVKEHLQVMFEDPAWYPSHIVLLIGMALIAASLVALARGRSLSGVPRAHLAAVIATVAASLAVPGMLLHLVAATDADAIAVHQSTPITDVQVIVDHHGSRLQLQHRGPRPDRRPYPNRRQPTDCCTRRPRRRRLRTCRRNLSVHRPARLLVPGRQRHRPMDHRRRDRTAPAPASCEPGRPRGVAVTPPSGSADRRRIKPAFEPSWASSCGATGVAPPMPCVWAFYGTRLHGPAATRCVRSRCWPHGTGPTSTDTRPQTLS